jgi:hypothetical protein
MPLNSHEYRGHDFDRRVCKFTMKNGQATVPCVISWEAMDDIERAQGVRPHEREAQFSRLRRQIENLASRKFFSYLDNNRPAEIVLTNKDRVAA